MTHEQFMTAAQEIADGCSIFVDDNIHRANNSRSLAMRIVFDDPTSSDGLGCKATGQHKGDNRYQDCLMDLKLIIFNAQKQPANTEAWRDENEAA